MSNSLRGMIAGFVATLVLGALLLLKSSFGLWPQLNIISLLSALGGISAAAAWMDHFIVGTVVWGLLFSLFDSVGSGLGHWLKGIIFGVFAWLMMMVLFMPAAGAGLFGNKIGIVAPIVMLGMHLIYGAVLGATYGLLTAWAPAKDPEASPQV
jgi:hypothetical protein